MCKYFRIKITNKILQDSNLNKRNCVQKKKFYRSFCFIIGNRTKGSNVSVFFFVTNKYPLYLLMHVVPSSYKMYVFDAVP